MLTEHQRDVARRSLDIESAKRTHIVVALSGAHAYGFPSPDSDLDLKGMHVAPTDDVLSMREPEQSADRLEVIDGVEIDYTSNEIGPALYGILKGNGNYIERVLGQHLLVRSEWLESLQELVRASLSIRVHHHYRGFATGQHKTFASAEAPTAKKALYVLRTALTGAHLLRTRELVVDVTELLDDYGFSEARDLIAAKKAGEHVVLSSDERSHWEGHLDRAFTQLEEARRASPLPNEPPNADELDEWLIALRRSR